LADLPAALQAPVSRAFGARASGYRMRVSGEGFAALNAPQGVSARFDRAGATFARDGRSVRLAFDAIGGASGLTRLPAVAPSSAGNRVAYAHPGVSEWYANGPLGLEQGFTVERAPTGGGPLTLAMGLSAGARPVVAADGRSARFGRGRSALRYTGLRATDARGRVLASRLETTAGRLLVRVDARHAIYPIQIDPWMLGEKVKGSGEFGDSVSLSSDGRTAIVGAYAANRREGAAFVFTRSGGTYVEQAELTGIDGEFGEGLFGREVALSADGNTALVGGLEDKNKDGAAWVFTRSGSTWTQQGPKLVPNDAEGEDTFFGSSVVLSADGSVALIGGPYDANGTGAAWIFTRSGSTWSQQGGKLTAAMGESGVHYFGGNVALSADGETALIGGQHQLPEEGLGWVFTRSGETWSQQGAPLGGTGQVNNCAEGAAGVALSADGNTAVIGKGADGHCAGAVWTFARSGSTWTQQGEKLTGAGGVGLGGFGGAVKLSGDAGTLLVAAANDNKGRGAVWAFSRSGEGWLPEGPKLSPNVGNAAFGSSLAISADGEIGLVGAIGWKKCAKCKATNAVWPLFTHGPIVSTIKPAQGPDKGGKSVKIKGLGLGEASAVWFGETQATSFKVSAAGVITAKTPPGTGTVHVTVTTPEGTSEPTTADEYSYVP
jgi:hypothetical protein